MTSRTFVSSVLVLFYLCLVSSQVFGPPRPNVPADVELFPGSNQQSSPKLDFSFKITNFKNAQGKPLRGYLGILTNPHSNHISVGSPQTDNKDTIYKPPLEACGASMPGPGAGMPMGEPMSQGPEESESNLLTTSTIVNAPLPEGLDPTQMFFSSSKGGPVAPRGSLRRMTPAFKPKKGDQPPASALSPEPSPLSMQPKPRSFLQIREKLSLRNMATVTPDITMPKAPEVSATDLEKVAQAAIADEIKFGLRPDESNSNQVDITDVKPEDMYPFIISPEQADAPVTAAMYNQEYILGCVDTRVKYYCPLLPLVEMSRKNSCQFAISLGHVDDVKKTCDVSGWVGSGGFTSSMALNSDKVAPLPFFGITQNGYFMTGYPGSEALFSASIQSQKLGFSFSGYGWMVRNSTSNVLKAVKTEKLDTDYVTSSLPRTAIGHDKDGRIIILHIEDDQNPLVGATMEELAQAFISVGGVNGMDIGQRGAPILYNGHTANRPTCAPYADAKECEKPAAAYLCIR